MSVVVSIAKGADASYPWRQIGAADGADRTARPGAGYYLSPSLKGGEPPGRWIGEGAKDLGFHDGDIVQRDAFERLYGEFTDPRDPSARTRLGRAPQRFQPADEIYAALLAAEPDATAERRAAALAHNQTGTPIAVHLDQAGHEAHRIIDILTRGGVDPHRIVIGHLDQRRVYEPDYLIAIARSGVMLGFDTFGTTYAYDSARIDDPTDSQRIELLARIVQAGFVGQCVLSHDVGCKSMLRRHGGGGYSHLLTDLRPSMLMRGLTEEALDQMFIRNPARWLAGDDPGSL